MQRESNVTRQLVFAWRSQLPARLSDLLMRAQRATGAEDVAQLVDAADLVVYEREQRFNKDTAREMVRSLLDAFAAVGKFLVAQMVSSV